MTTMPKGFTFTHDSPDGTEEWTFECDVYPPDPDTGFYYPSWDVVHAFDPEGEEMDWEEHEEQWVECVERYADEELEHRMYDN